MRQRNNTRWIPLIQGIYFTITALWPIININNFMAVTGYKTDIWLIYAVSVLLAPLIVILFNVAFRPTPIPLTYTLAIIAGTAGLMVIEFTYYFNGTISKIYLADAILELIFLLWWIYMLSRHFGRKKYNVRYNN